MLINFLVQTLQSIENLILYLFCPSKYEKNQSKVWDFNEIKENFITALATLTVSVKLMFSNLVHKGQSVNFERTFCYPRILEKTNKTI